MSVYIQTNQTIQLPDSDYTVSSADTGKIFLINTVTAARLVTLPTPSVAIAGLHYIFLNKAPGALGAINQNVRIYGGGGGLMRGVANNFNGVLVVSNDGVNFVATTTTRGDRCEVYCDGVQWSVLCHSAIAGGFTAN